MVRVALVVLVVSLVVVVVAFDVDANVVDITHDFKKERVSPSHPPSPICANSFMN